ncbi:MAG: Hsp20/alpha crystallin family protein [Bacteroidales bacterium]
MTLLSTYRKPTMERRTESNFSELLNRFFDDEKRDDCQYFALPPANIKETDDNYIIEMAVPGFDKKDFNIELNESILKISVNKKPEEQNYLRKEFQFNDFSREFKLSDKVEQDKIKGQYENGMLEITIPKKESAKKVNRSIKVE